MTYGKHLLLKRKRVLLLLGWHSPRIEEGIVRYAREANWLLDLQTLRTGSFPEIHDLDGILSMLGGWEVRPDLTRFAQRAAGIPIVDMHADESETVPAGRVLSDNITIGRLAAEHFLDRGFRHFAYCCRSLTDWSANERELGFRTRLAENGLRSSALECASSNETGAWPVQHVVTRIKDHLTEAPRPLGVFAENDDLAVTILDACEQADLKVPEEVAMLGCGNDPLVVDFASVPLSSMDSDYVTRSYEAAKLLDLMMASEAAPPQPIRIKPIGVVLRRSTDILAADDKRVATALKIIRVRFATTTLGPQDVANECGVNLRTLNRIMFKHLGRSIADDIRMVRFEHARELISTTDLNLSQIAQRSGFSSLLHLRRIFTHQTGASPRQWRHNRLMQK